MKTSYLTADLNELTRNVDWSAVHAAVESTSGFDKLPGYERDEVKELIWLAAEAWLARDLQEFSEIRVETAFLDGKAIVDLMGRLRGTMKPYEDFVGDWVLVDWKTTMSSVDTDEWRNRCLDSWQWKIYLSLSPDFKIFNYRGLSRARGVMRGKGPDAVPASRVREVHLEGNLGLKAEVEEHKKGCIAMYNSLVDTNLLVWPRNTKNCYAFGQRCPYKRDCDSNSMPLGIELVDKVTDMSHSRMEALLLCPERLRRSKHLASPIGDESDATIVGTAFHAGVAKLWEEAFK